MKCIVLCLFVFALNFQSCSAFANWLTTDFCDRSLVVGEVIMNEVIIYSDARNIKIFRDGSDISSSGFYYPGEKLTVQLSDISKQYVIETTNAQIENGGCDGRRIADKNNVLLTMPELDVDGSEVLIWAGWADGHSQVSITEPIKFVPSKTTKPPAGTGLGRSQALASKLKPVESEEEEDDDEVHEPKLIHRGRIDFMTTKKGKKNANVDPEDLLVTKKQLRGGKKVKDHISSVDTPSVFESRHGRRIIDNTAAVAAAAAAKSEVVDTPEAVDAEAASEGKKTGQGEGTVELPKLNSRRRGNNVHFNHEDQIKEAQKVGKQRKLDKKAAQKAKADAALDESWLAHLAHIKLTFFESACVLVIFVLFVGTLAFQIGTGKFKFQYLRHYKLRVGNKYAQ